MNIFQMLFDATKRMEPSRHQPRQDARAYDFTIPHHFTPDHRLRLQEFAESAAQSLTTTLSVTLRGAYPVQLAELGEQYRDRQKFPPKSYFINLLVGEKMVGFLLLQNETAVGWVTQLLGGSADTDAPAERVLSNLETDLVHDVAVKVVRVLSEASRDCGGPVFTLAPGASTLLPDMEDKKQIVHFCHLTFQRADGQKKLPFTFVILSSELESIAGIVPPPDRHPDEIRKDMQAHLESVQVPVLVRLDAVDVTMRDLATLEAGDIVLLQTRPTQPIDVIVSERRLCPAGPCGKRAGTDCKSFR
jgi:flagellar motor switch protein FliM